MRRRLLALSVFIALAAPAFAQAPPVPLIERAKFSAIRARWPGGSARMVSGSPGLRRGTACSISGWLQSQTRAPPSRSLPKPNGPSVRYFWSPDSKTILFLNDSGGDENFLLYGVDVASGTQKTLTPFEKTRALVVGISRVVKDRILVGLNNRDPRWHDVHSLDLATGKLTLVLQNDGGYAGYTADEQLVPRIAQKSTDDGGPHSSGS